CDPNSRTCLALPTAGQACLSPVPPDTGLACSDDPALLLRCDTTGGGAGTCRGPGNVGDTCDPFAFPQSSPCVKGLYCDRTTMMGTTLPGFGMSCQNSNQQCADPYYCRYDSTTFMYTCDQRASVTQPCDGTSNIQCDLDLYCDTTIAAPVCKNKLPNG